MSQQLTNARTPYALVHMMAAHTASHYELIAQGSGCTWSVCHVHFCFSPAGCSLFWISEILTGIDHAFYWSLLTGIVGLVQFKMNQLRSYQFSGHENYTFKRWLLSFLRNEMALHLLQLHYCHHQPCQNYKTPTCLYCTDIRIIISFLVVQIDYST